MTLIAVLHTLLSFNPQELKKVCQECMNYYIVQQPKAMVGAGYQVPDFLWCVQWLSDSCSDIRIAARVTMNAIIRMLPSKDLNALYTRCCMRPRARGTAGAVLTDPGVVSQGAP